MTTGKIESSTGSSSSTTPTLERDEYTSSAVFELERARLFHRGWMVVGHASTVPAGHRRVFDLVGQSVIVTRDREGTVHAFANACRHRGAQLCDPHDPTVDVAACATPSLQCPYHAWTYALDGRLLSTPRVEADEIDRADHGLWSYRAAEHNGVIFVSLATDGDDLETWLAERNPGLAEFADLRVAEMVVTERTVADVAANWKIIIENYQECLHCAVVHPELVEVVPLYRTGHVLDPARDDGAVEIAGNSFSASGHEDLPTIPGLAREHTNLYRGTVVFPNAFLDVTATSVALTTLLPVAADRTLVIGEYLFSPDVDETHRSAIDHVVAFNELVGAQDYVVCEGVQRGVSSAAFTAGVLTRKDALVAEFDEQYRQVVGPSGPAT